MLIILLYNDFILGTKLASYFLIINDFISSNPYIIFLIRGKSR